MGPPKRHVKPQVAADPDSDDLTIEEESGNVEIVHQDSKGRKTTVRAGGRGGTFLLWSIGFAVFFVGFALAALLFLAALQKSGLLEWILSSVCLVVGLLAWWLRSLS